MISQVVDQQIITGHGRTRGVGWRGVAWGGVGVVAWGGVGWRRVSGGGFREGAADDLGSEYVAPLTAEEITRLRSHLLVD